MGPINQVMDLQTNTSTVNPLTWLQRFPRVATLTGKRKTLFHCEQNNFLFLSYMTKHFTPGQVFLDIHAQPKMKQHRVNNTSYEKPLSACGRPEYAALL